MRWSQLSSQQRAWLSARATWRPIIVRGKLVKHEPVNSYAKAIVIAKALDRDRDDQRQAAHKAANQALIEAYDGPIKRCNPMARTKTLRVKGNRLEYVRGPERPQVSYAYGAKERVKGQALPMQYFRKGGTA